MPERNDNHQQLYINELEREYQGVRRYQLPLLCFALISASSSGKVSARTLGFQQQKAALR
jgi:hypothetical protein